MEATLLSNKVTTGVAAKTILQILAAANHALVIKSAWVGFEGVVTTNAPVLVEILRQSTAGTGGDAVTPKKIDDGSTTLEATGLSGPSGTWSAEPTAGDIVFRDLVHPQSRDRNILPFDSRIVVPAGGRLAIRVTAANAVDCVAGFQYQE